MENKTNELKITLPPHIRKAIETILQENKIDINDEYTAIEPTEEGILINYCKKIITNHKQINCYFEAILFWNELETLKD